MPRDAETYRVPRIRLSTLTPSPPQRVGLPRADPNTSPRLPTTSGVLNVDLDLKPAQAWMLVVVAGCSAEAPVTYTRPNFVLAHVQWAQVIMAHLP
jgi:hypothetical protein